MKILIATDGSIFSKAAIEEFCRTVKNTKDTRVKVVSAYEEPIMVAAAPYAMPIQFDAHLENTLREQAGRAAAEAEAQIRAYFPDINDNLTTAVMCGAPEQMIVEEAESWGANLIVVGSHGYGFWERMFLGSVSSAIAHHAPCSIMIVRNSNCENGEN